MNREQRSHLIAEVYGGNYLQYNVPRNLMPIIETLQENIVSTDNYTCVIVSESTPRYWRINKTQPQVDTLQKAIVFYHAIKGHIHCDIR
jgi:hypothetical protein